MRIFLIFFLINFLSFSVFAEEVQEEENTIIQEEAVSTEDSEEIQSEDQVLVEDFPVLSGEARQIKEDSEEIQLEGISNHSLKVGLILFALTAIGLSFVSKGRKKNV